MRQRFSQFAQNARAGTARFMAGRHGNDQLNNFLLAVTLGLLVLSIFLKGTAKSLLSLLALGLLGLNYFRMLSRNHYKRQDENMKYLRLRDKISSFFRLKREQWRQRKDYKFFSCPCCRCTLRVPRGRGRISIVCRKCGTSFIRNS